MKRAALPFPKNGTCSKTNFILSYQELKSNTMCMVAIRYELFVQCASQKSPRKSASLQLKIVVRLSKNSNLIFALLSTTGF